MSASDSIVVRRPRSIPFGRASAVAKIATICFGSSGDEVSRDAFRAAARTASTSTMSRSTACPIAN
jgi:hypothetical protein